MIIVTSGGLSEKIDNVRKIVNSSSGKLGSLIAQKFLEKGIQIFYVHTSNIASIKGAVSVPVSDINMLELEIKNLLEKYPIKAVIHAMAVSDYHVEGIYKDGEIIPILAKLDSSEERVLLSLKRNPKIISIIKEIKPDVILIGFKLTVNKTEEERIKIANEQMEKNNCNYVLVNDSTEVGEYEHKAMLISQQEIFHLKTKEEIANKITEVVG